SNHWQQSDSKPALASWAATPSKSRRRKQQPADESDVLRLIELGALQEAAKLQTEFQARCDQIDKLWGFTLHDELAAQNMRARVTAQKKKDFRPFQVFCSKHAWPDWEAPPQAILDFLCDEFKHGAAHVSRLCRSLSVVFDAAGLNNSTTDILVRAFVRRV